MSATFHFDLVTPEKGVLSQDETMVVIPGAEGYFGVLPGHAPLVAMLAMGVLTVGEGRQAVCYALSGGYADVLPARTTILADQVVCWDAIQSEQVEAEQQESLAQLESLKSDDRSRGHWEKRRDFSKVCLDLHKKYLSRDGA